MHASKKLLSCHKAGTILKLRAKLTPLRHVHRQHVKRDQPPRQEPVNDRLQAKVARGVKGQRLVGVGLQQQRGQRAARFRGGPLEELRAGRRVDGGVGGARHAAE